MSDPAFKICMHRECSNRTEHMVAESGSVVFVCNEHLEDVVSLCREKPIVMSGISPFQNTGGDK